MMINAKKQSLAWNDADLLALAKGHVNGQSINALASLLDRSFGSIQSQLYGALNTKKTPTALKLAKLIDNAKLEKLAAAQQSLKPQNHRAVWDDVADKKLVEAFMRGFTADETAKICGRTMSSVAGRLKELGVLSFDKETCSFKTMPVFAKVWYKF